MLRANPHGPQTTAGNTALVSLLHKVAQHRGTFATSAGKSAMMILSLLQRLTIDVDQTLC
jgi:hypothetical protein